MTNEIPGSTSSPPGIAERVVDAAADVSHTIEEVTARLQSAVDRLRAIIKAAEQPGQPLDRLRRTTREAPIASLFIAFMLGVAITRRR